MNWATNVAFLVQGTCHSDADLRWRIGQKWTIGPDMGLLLLVGAAWEEAGMSGMRVPKAVQEWLAKV
jgi:hypothetical protein